MTKENLIKLAHQAREKSYSPYSDFSVGAALLCDDDSVFLGCNIENSSYSATICAERVAIFKAISEGKKDFKAIAVVGGKSDDKTGEFCVPCGVCLQAMNEFCNKEFLTFKIYLEEKGEIKEYLLKDLLPLTFSGEVL
jgi:cytidine deaminase